MNTQIDNSCEKFFNNVLEHTVNRDSSDTPDCFNGSGAVGCCEESNGLEAKTVQQTKAD
ncbi:MAG: hypothetical protein HQL69_11465 [Magnetococcales bacterium]|nr:hypothetical protein [Magnetococcales bacterium]